VTVTLATIRRSPLLGKSTDEEIGMKAIAIDDFATDPTLRDLPDPKPSEGEVLVRVAASSVNGMDLSVASGMVKGMMEYELPIVLGRD
jgi:NADPH:quinone reductase-like Zn-dependent oxidoreductase